MTKRRPLVRLQGRPAQLPIGDFVDGLGSSVTAIAANTTVTSAVHGNHPVIQVTAAGVQVTLGADFDIGTYVTVLPQTATTHSSTVLPGANTITSLRGTTLKTLYAHNQAVLVQCVGTGLWVARSVKAANAAAITLPFTLTDDEDDMLLNVSATGNLTVPAGLRASFGCRVNVVTGTASVLSAGGALLNGAATTVLRPSNPNLTFEILQLPTANSFRVTGSTIPLIPQLTANASGTLVNTSSSPVSYLSGSGGGLGSPTVTPTCVNNGAGVLVGFYQYAYSEGDTGGYSSLSPIGSVTAASNTVRITIGMPRRAVNSQQLWRKNPGAADFRLVHIYGGGYFQNVWDDNVPDATVSAAAIAPTTDNTTFFDLEVKAGVKNFRTHPSVSGPADLTVLTGNSGYESGAYSIDAYAPIVARTLLGNCFQATKTGTNSNLYAGLWQDVVDDNVAPTTVFQVKAKGNLSVTPGVLSDAGAGDGLNLALGLSATFASVNTAAAVGSQIAITGAGSSVQTQTAISGQLSAGYTGASPSYMMRAVNQTAGTGTAFGIDSTANGAAAVAVGLSGRSGNGTKNIGVFGSGDGFDLSSSSLTFPGGVSSIGGAFSNGTSTGDIVTMFDDATAVFRFTNNGGFVGSGLAANASTAYDFGTDTKGVCRLLANGNNDIQFGSTNNVPLFLRTNSVNRVLLPTTGGVVVGPTSLVTTASTLAMNKITTGGAAPGAAGARFEVVAGTTAGTAKLVMYAGTSTTATTIIDNVGAGVV